MASLLGLGMALPERAVDNDELAAELGCTVQELDSRGVNRRHFAEAGQGPSDLARIAAEGALAEAGLDPSDIDFIVFATMTPDVTFPGSGCYLQHKLGCGTVGALDLRAQCSGFPFAIDVASSFLEAGMYRRVLVAAGEVYSSGLDFSTKGVRVTPLFGDGAAVAILGAEGKGIRRSVLHTDASELEQFWCEFPSSRRIPTRFLESDLAEGKHYPAIDEERVRGEGRLRLQQGIEEILEREGLSLDDVPHFVLQHVYPDVAREVADSLGIAKRTVVGGGDTGHVASASLGISLARARSTGAISAGDLVCLATAGAGSTWAATLLEA